jgi:hypothetical protein
MLVRCNTEKILLASFSKFLGLPYLYLFVRIRILPLLSNKIKKNLYFCQHHEEEDQEADP